jgi:RNA polymerase sigma-70 factor (ECF subfamily)
MARQELAAFRDAVNRLPPRCRAVFILRKLELLPHEEIARRLGITVSTVDKQLARALRLIRADMDEADGSASVGRPGEREARS